MLLTFDHQPMLDGTSEGHVYLVEPTADVDGSEDLEGAPSYSMFVTFAGGGLTGTSADVFTSTGLLSIWFADNLPLVMPPSWTYFGVQPTPFMLAIIRNVAAVKAAALKAGAL